MRQIDGPPGSSVCGTGAISPAAHFGSVAAQENVAVEDEALRLIARAADGSVRDGLSLLDQAIALAGEGAVTAEAVRGMLGLADRAQVWDLFEALMAGRITGRRCYQYPCAPGSRRCPKYT